jgi:hypothetical protein
MNVIKNHFKGNFTMVPNELIKDNSLPIATRFLYIFLILQPENWQFQTWKLCKKLPMNPETFRKHRDKLCEYGWIKVEKQKFNGKRFESRVYHLYPEPKFRGVNAEKTKVQKKRNFRSSKNSVTEEIGDRKNHAHINKEYKEKKENNNKNYNLNKQKNSSFQNPNPRQK